MADDAEGTLTLPAPTTTGLRAGRARLPGGVPTTPRPARPRSAPIEDLPPARVEFVFDESPAPAMPDDPRGDPMLHRPVAGAVGPLVLANGWPCYPEEYLSRRPCPEGRGMPKIRPEKLRGVTDPAVYRRLWIANPRANLSLICGGGQGVFAVEVDVADAAVSRAVRDCAVRCLGAEGPVRWSDATRVAMLYRSAPGFRVEPSTHPFLDQGTRKVTDNQVRVIGHDGHVLAYGRDPRGGYWLKWGGAGLSPMTGRPEDLPEVTDEQLTRFRREVRAITDPEGLNGYERWRIEVDAGEAPRYSLDDIGADLLAGNYVEVSAEELARQADPLRPLLPGERRLDTRHVYMDFAQRLATNGWPNYPQQRTGNRKPALFGGTLLKWGELRGVTDPARYRNMALRCSTSNVAIILGHEGLFAIDIDVDDHALAHAVRDCAARCLGGGELRFMRIGRAPRAIMLFRTKPGVHVRNKAYSFAMPDDVTKASGHKLEVLGHDGCFTAVGTHHSTGGWFTWPDRSPWDNRIDEVQVVEEEQISWFLKEVQVLRPFVRGAVKGSNCSRGDSSDEVAYDETVEGRLPRLRRDGPWDWVDGRIVDGRRAYTLRYSYLLVCSNANAWRAPDGGESLLMRADEHLRATLAPNHAKDEHALLREFRTIAKSDIENLRSGDLRELTLHRQPDGTLVKPGRLIDVTDRDPALDWLGQRDQALGVVGKVGHSNKGVTVVASAPATEEKKKERALRTDRTEAAAKVRDVTEEAVDAFLDDVTEDRPGLRVLKAPTGGGKTVLTVSKGVLHKRDTKGELRPLLMVMPTHRNVAEAVAVARESRAVVHVPGDEEQADEEAANAFVRMLRRKAVRGVHWKSKIGAGCLRADEVGAMQAAGFGSDGICGPDPVPGEDEDAEGAPARCRFRNECGYQRMKAEASRTHVIFASHYWVTADRLPRQLEDVSGVVVDESVTLAVLQAARVAVPEMRAPRPVHLTRDEWDRIKTAFGDDREREDREAKRDALVADLLAARARAVDLLERAAGGDPARVFTTTSGALEDAAVAERVCRGAIRGASSVTPDMSREDVLALCAAHPPSPGAAVEARVWATVREAAKRFADMGCAHADPEVHGPTLHGHSGHPAFVGPVWPGPVDARLQPLQETDKSGTTRYWRVSWRRETNWGDKPRLLLDATADEGLVRATFPEVADAQFAWHQVSTDLNLRAVLVHGATFSPSSMVIADDDEPGVKKRKRQTVVDAQRLISMVTAAHGHGRTVACLPIRAREAVLARFDRSPTLDSMHFGATRGINAARAHAAAVGVGRSEWPAWLLDGVVAAATWDRCPQLPMDRLGTGVDAAGKPVRRKPEGRLVRMRDGRDLWIPVPVAPSDWGRRLDAQWREAEMIQFMGRLRPVHRGDTATYVHACSVFPEGIVWDEVLSVDEMLSRRGHEVWEAVVAAGGVVDEVLTPQRMLSEDKAADRVRSFVRAYGSCPGFRRFDWTDKACVRHEGLVAVWQRDVTAALQALGAPQECLDSYLLDKLVESLRPSMALEDDKVSSAFLRPDELDLLERDWQEASGSEMEDEDAAAHRARFRAEWRRPPPETDDLGEAAPELPDEDDPCST